MSTSVTTDPPHAKVVHTREELVNELAAVALAILDAREERTKANKNFNSKIKNLEKRQRELAMTVRTSPGMRESLQMTFPSIIPQPPPDEEDDDQN